MSQAQDMLPQVALPTRRQLAIGSTIAVVVASVTMVFFVLPAELGIDPTGFGKATGLTGLAQSGTNANIYLERGLKRTNVLFPLAATARPDEATLRSTLASKGLAAPANLQIRSDHWEYELLPYENIEMKYRLAQGQPMIFSWRTSAPVNYDMHSVPDQGGNPMTESFSITAGPSQTAVYVAPFSGIHGWFWQNRSLKPVTLAIDATGGFAGAVIFNASGEFPRTLADEKDSDGEASGTAP
jgi:hypothetical protein